MARPYDYYPSITLRRGDRKVALLFVNVVVAAEVF